MALAYEFGCEESCVCCDWSFECRCVRLYCVEMMGDVSVTINFILLLVLVPNVR